jgi:predicted amidophosphoribosyltransferase
MECPRCDGAGAICDECGEPAYKHDKCQRCFEKPLKKETVQDGK